MQLRLVAVCGREFYSNTRRVYKRIPIGSEQYDVDSWCCTATKVPTSRNGPNLVSQPPPWRV